MLIASIILKNPFSLNSICQALSQLPKIQAQQGDFQQYNAILGDGGLLMVDQDLFGLVVLFECFVLFVDLEVDIPELVVLVSNG